MEENDQNEKNNEKTIGATQAPSTSVEAQPQATILPPVSLPILERVRGLSEISFPVPLQLQSPEISIEPPAAASVLNGIPHSLSTEPVYFYLTAPTYVSRIEIEGTNNISDNVQMSYSAYDGSEVIVPIQKESNGNFRVHVGAFTSQVELSRLSGFGWKKKIQLDAIRILGYPGPASKIWMEAFSTLSDEIDYCRESISQELVKAQGERQQIDSDREALKVERSDHESKIQAIRAQIRETEDDLGKKQVEKATADQDAAAAQVRVTQIESEVKDAQTVLNEAKTKHSDITKEMEERRATAGQLTREIAEKKSKLDELNRDESLFAVDLKGYGEQGWRQSRYYLGMIAISIVAITIVTIFAFSEVNTIWDAIVADPERIKWSLIAITRFGMILIFTASIGGLSTIGYAFLKRLIQIQERALDLSAVSILARDVTNATIVDDTVTSAQKMAAFYAARMALVRNLLAGLFEKLAASQKEERDTEVLKFNDLDMRSILKLLVEKGVDAIKKA